ncbi:MAG: putative sugar O-methyltransferase [Candidatus Korobacteraceae bacterium]
MSNSFSANRLRYYFEKVKYAHRSGSLSLKLKKKAAEAVYVPSKVAYDYCLHLSPEERHLNIEEGFRDHRTKCKVPSKSTLERLVRAYKYSQSQQPASTPFGVRGLWREWIDINYGPMIDAIEREDFDVLGSLMINFNREQMAVGTGGAYGDLVKYNGLWLGKPYVKTVWCRYRKLLAEAGVDPGSVSFPMIGNPAGVPVGDVIIQSETFRHAYKANRMISMLDGTLSNTVVEIGAGFGGCAYQVMQRSNGVVGSYVIFDIPEVAFVSAYFLIEAFPHRVVRLFGEGPINAKDYDIGVFPHFSFEQLPDQSADLVFNSCSFSEMDRETSSQYLNVIERVCRRYFFHVNHDVRLTFDSSTDGRSVNRLGSELIPDPKVFKAVYKKPRVFGRPDDRFYPAHEFLYERVATSTTRLCASTSSTYTRHC